MPTIEQELAAEFAALTTAAVPMPGDAKPETETPAAEAKPEGEKPTGEAPAADAKPETEKAAKPETETKTPPDSMARRLSIIARTEREAKRAKEEAERIKSELAPMAEKLKAAKGAKSKFEAVKLALDLDDEGMAELFLELHDNHSGIRDKALKEETPEERFARLAAETVDKKLKERDEATKAAEAKALDDHRAAYATETFSALEAASDRFPLVAVAPPSAVDITTIAEAWLTANGVMPEPEEVLKLIQTERQERFDKASKKPEGKTNQTPGNSASAKAGEGSGRQSVRDNDVAVGGRKPMTIAEEMAEAFKLSPQA